MKLSNWDLSAGAADGTARLLIADTLREPFGGIGKPEPLRENPAGFWSRRIDEGNRRVHAVDDDHLTMIACRYHD